MYYRFDNVDDAFNLFNKMIQSYPKPSIVEFTKLLAAIVRMKHYAITVSMCSQMELLGVYWDVYSLSILVNCFCQLGQIDLGFPVLGNMLKLGVEPYVVTLSALINGWVKGIRPDIVSYNILIDAHYKDGKIFEVIDTVDTMKKQGIEPDVVTYIILVDVHCREGMVSEAKDDVGTMIKQGIEPDVVTYNILVDAHCREGMVSEAEDIVDAIIKHNIEPNVVTYSALINCHCLQNKMYKARKVFQLMIKKGCAPDIFSYNIMINGYCEAKRIDEEMELFHEISQKGPILDIVTHNTLMQVTCSFLSNGLCKCDKLEEALEVFQAMRNSKLELDIVCYNILIDGLCKSGRDCQMKHTCCLGAWEKMIQGFLRNSYTSKATLVPKEMIGTFTFTFSSLGWLFPAQSFTCQKLKQMAGLNQQLEQVVLYRSVNGMLCSILLLWHSFKPSLVDDRVFLGVSTFDKFS
ncbi:hypothetical protein F383_15566 [Gossypium arboreum]|uniref:Uncharacterized protein n=1 Tax=Gossypium arboreum TaxID=29729 RepID=A0A0B0NAZ4_GOSAR|nr:hypothetical protein F383_15566 [Gossypium arboreum]